MKAEAMLGWYERWMNQPVYTQYYEHSGYFNFGYWDGGAKTQAQACEHLIERLLNFLPERRGRLVDMACGMGATTAYLISHCPEMNILGANLSWHQLQAARQVAPRASFAMMDAAYPALASGCADVILCVEAAFHFQTRRQFLAEAYRVLKPDGHLVLADILFHRLPGNIRPYVPVENFVGDEGAYRQELLASGFTSVKTVDATRTCWQGYLRHTRSWAMRQLRARQIPLIDYLRLMIIPLVGPFLVKRYLLAAARKA